MIKRFLPILTLMLAFVSCSASTSNADASASADQTSTDTTAKTLMITKDIPEGSKKVLVHTSMGDFTLLLYGDTPGHRDNFLKHVENHDYDSVLFHRVINQFMVQAGDPSSKNAGPDARLGASQAGTEIPAEIVFPKHFHKYGALAAARTGDAMNPERKSSGSQFYIVTGKKVSPSQLEQMDQRLKYSVAQNYFNSLAQQHIEEIRKLQAERDTTALNALQKQLVDQTEAWMETQDLGMTDEMREVYTTIGGTPHLDNEYTVYGEVISGMDVIEKIQNTPTGAADRPIKDVRILSMEVIE